MEYADWKPLPPTPSEILKKELEQKDVEKQQNTYIRNMKLEKIKSDYLNGTPYYYQKASNQIFSFGSFFSSPSPLPVEKKIQDHLREINNLPREYVELHP